MVKRPAGITIIAGQALAQSLNSSPGFGASAFPCPAARALGIICNLYCPPPFSAMG
jgi:hypothetical protein